MSRDARGTCNEDVHIRTRQNVARTHRSRVPARNSKLRQGVGALLARPKLTAKFRAFPANFRPRPSTSIPSVAINRAMLPLSRSPTKNDKTVYPTPANQKMPVASSDRNYMIAPSSDLALWLSVFPAWVDRSVTPSLETLPSTESTKETAKTSDALRAERSKRTRVNARRVPTHKSFCALVQHSGWCNCYANQSASICSYIAYVSCSTTCYPLEPRPRDNVRLIRPGSARV